MRWLNTQFARAPITVLGPRSEIVFALAAKLDPLLARPTLDLPLFCDQHARVIVQEIPTLLFVSSRGTFWCSSHRCSVVTTLTPIGSTERTINVIWNYVTKDNRHIHQFPSLTLLDMSRPFVHRILQLTTHPNPPVASFAECSVWLQFATVRLFSQVLNPLFFRSSDRSS